MSHPVISPVAAQPSVAKACLDAISRAAGVRYAALYRIDEYLNPVDFRLSGLPTAMHLSYLKVYQRFDPLRPERCVALGQSLLPLAQAQAAQPAVLRATYQEFLHQHQVRDIVELMVSHRGRPALGVSLLRTAEERPFRDRELDSLAGLHGLLELAVPHLCMPVGQSLETLTPRERELAERLREGACNKQLAQAMGVGLPTVKTHLINLYRKVGVRNRTELVSALFLSAAPH